MAMSRASLYQTTKNKAIAKVPRGKKLSPKQKTIANAPGGKPKPKIKMSPKLEKIVKKFKKLKKKP